MSYREALQDRILQVAYLAHTQETVTKEEPCQCPTKDTHWHCPYCGMCQQKEIRINHCCACDGDWLTGLEE